MNFSTEANATDVGNLAVGSDYYGTGHEY